MRDARFYPVLIFGIIAIFAAAWWLRKDAYPVTTVPMFSARSSETLVRYTRLYERYADGSLVLSRPEHDLAIFRYTRYRTALNTCFSSSDDRCKPLLAAMSQSARANGRDVSAYVVERWSWDFAAGPCCGDLVTRLEFPVSELADSADAE